MRATYFILFVLFLGLVSCDKRKDFYGTSNSAVTGQLFLLNTHSGATAIWNNERSVSDSLKLNKTYKFKINVTDENAMVKGVFSGDGSIVMNGSSFTAANVSTGMNTFEWTAVNEGWNLFYLTFEDSYGIETAYEFNIFVFENKLPYTTWVLEHVGNLSPLEKRIVVTGSDGDQIYGGNILYYQYIINGDTTNFPGSQFYYVFPSAGNYSIGVRAMDNNWQWGNEITISNYAIN